MRLRAVEHRHRLAQRLKLTLIRLVSGRRVPDVVKTLLYRPELFGRAMCDWTQAVMRGPSEWSVGERELFAAFTSRLEPMRVLNGRSRRGRVAGPESRKQRGQPGRGGAGRLAHGAHRSEAAGDARLPREAHAHARRRASLRRRAAPRRRRER